MGRLPARLAAVLLLTIPVLAACGGGHEPGVTATAPGAQLETLVVAAGPGEGERMFDGIVEAVQQATIAAQTSGRIVALGRDVDDPVARGDMILRISGVEQRARLDGAQQALTEARAVAAEARARYARVSDLAARKLLSGADLDRATADRDAAEARLASAEAGVAAAQEQFGYTEIRAPFAGVVTARHVEVGEAVSPGQPLTAVAALGALRVNVDVPQAFADEIRGLGAARVYAGKQVLDSAQVTVFPAAASASNTVRVRIDLEPGVGDLYPGMFVKAGFRSGEPAALRVPARVVVRRSEVTAVYVVGEDRQVRLRQVRLGRQAGDEYEVLAGLSAGERVAADPVAATLVVEGR
ncbi:MAG: efflux transporter, family, subunit [Proteobacteria bacterium]|nr:efflux transporter, family, subunit [Pseudomonadota bacterium]